VIQSFRRRSIRESEYPASDTVATTRSIVVTATNTLFTRTCPKSCSVKIRTKFPRVGELGQWM